MKFISTSLSSDLDWAEAETLRFARRFMHSFSAAEIADHLRHSDRHTRRVLYGLVERNLLMVTNRKQRYQTYRLAIESVEVSSLTGVSKI